MPVCVWFCNYVIEYKCVCVCVCVSPRMCVCICAYRAPMCPSVAWCSGTGSRIGGGGGGGHSVHCLGLRAGEEPNGGRKGRLGRSVPPRRYVNPPPARPAPPWAPMMKSDCLIHGTQKWLSISLDVKSHTTDSGHSGGGGGGDGPGRTRARPSARTPVPQP